MIAYLLHGDEVCSDERDVIDLVEHANNTTMVDTRNQHSQQISQQSWLFLEVERKSLVVTV